MQIDIEVSGRGCDALSAEVGGHRIQRVPPTEKRGRVHTSTVTVAVVEPDARPTQIEISESDLQIVWFSGTGKGGQHRNKHQNSCRVTHLPSGITESRQSREKEVNLRDALAAINERLVEAESHRRHAVTAGERRQQVGSGMRGDKTVTIRFQDDSAVNHTTGRSMSARRYMRGEMDAMW